MSYVEDDERLLLTDLERQLSGNFRPQNWGLDPIYPIPSYILKNVAGFRLDGWKMAPPNVSDERGTEITVDEFYAIVNRYLLQEFDFKEMMEQVGRMEIMDEHTFAVSFIRTHSDFIYNNMLACLTSFAMTHGVWLLALKLIYADSSEEEEDINMVFNRVVSFLSTLRGKKIERNDFCMYVSLVSTVTRTPSDGWKSMESLYSLILAMLDVSAAVQFLALGRGKFLHSPKDDEFDSLLLLSMYWVLYGVAVCSSQCNALPKNGYVIQDSEKLNYVRDKLTSVHRRLQKLKIDWTQLNDDEKIKNAYKIQDKRGPDSDSALTALFGNPLLDRSEGLDELRLSRCDRKDMDLSVTAMKHKILLLLISGLDISSNEIVFLRDAYIECKTSVQQDHEVIWVPIQRGLWTTSFEKKYTKLLQMMPWYTVEHPSSISETTTKFIRQVWKFKRRPIMIVIDENGDVVGPNGIHTMYIWRFKGFPFTPLRQRTLWTNEMRLDSLVFNFDPNISTMLEVGKWVVLYGGNDIEWSRKFTIQVRKVLSDTNILAEMIYIGENIEIEPEFSSLNLKKVWYFWTRLESLLISRYQSFSTRDDSGMDPILREVEKLLSYKSAGTWACIRIPSSDSMIHGLGDIMLQGFMEFEMWKQHVQTKEFARKFKNHIEQLQESFSGHVCSRMVLHIDDKDAVERLKCPSCNHSMEKRIQYRCCHGDEIE